MSTSRKRRRKLQLGPTQKDIADALGVSQSTVAMALSPHYENRLLEETAQRIKKYAEEVGYHPQRFAQIMQGSHTKVVGVVVRMGPYSLNTTLVNQLANECTRHGYQIVVVDPAWFDGDTEGVKRYLLDQGVEGVIICNIVTEESNEIASNLPERLPTIGFQSMLEKSPSFYIDPLSAYYDITRIHIVLGARRLSLLLPFRDPGYLTPPGFTIITRATGFIRAIEEAGGEVLADRSVAELIDQPRLVECPSGKEPLGEIIYTLRQPGTTTIQQHGYQQATRLIKSGNLPRALICGNDDLAQGALAAFSDHGVAVPDDIFLSGYDDTVAGQFAAIPLTSIRPRAEEATRAAVKRLLAMIEKPDANPPTPGSTLFLNDIILRRSSGSIETLSALVENDMPELASRAVVEESRKEATFRMMK